MKMSEMYAYFNCYGFEVKSLKTYGCCHSVSACEFTVETDHIILTATSLFLKEIEFFFDSLNIHLLTH